MDGFADYESDEETPAAPPPAFAVRPDEESSEEEEDEEESNKAQAELAAAAQAEEKRKRKEAEGGKRVSAASALLSATTKPSFLQEKEQEAFELNVDEPIADHPPAKKQAVAPAPAAAPQPQASAPARPSLVGVDKKGPSKDSGKGKADPKDRVKTQRMRGQSAHATWKSEGEMKLRQGYD